MDGVDLIGAERARQVAELGHDAEHDDMRHGDQGLAWAAVCYLAPDHVLGKPGGSRFTVTSLPVLREPLPQFWGAIERLPRPVNPNDLIPEDEENFSLTIGEGFPAAQVRERRVRELVKAGALVAAEIDRILRADD